MNKHNKFNRELKKMLFNEFKNGYNEAFRKLEKLSELKDKEHYRVIETEIFNELKDVFRNIKREN